MGVVALHALLPGLRCSQALGAEETVVLVVLRVGAAAAPRRSSLVMTGGAVEGAVRWTARAADAGWAAQVVVREQKR